MFSVTTTSKDELLPIALAACGRIQGTRFGKSLLVLFDSGSTTTWFSRKSLPKDIHGYTVPSVTGSTLAGTFTSKEQVCLNDLMLPEFSDKKVLHKINAKVFDAECRYDMILGRDALRAFGISLDFDQQVMTADGVSRPMREFPRNLYGDDLLPTEILLQEYLDEKEFNDGEWFKDSSDKFDDGYAEMADSKYDGATPKEIADTCTHLTSAQRRDLEKLFSKFEKLFDGKLRTYTDEKIHLEVDSSIQPHRSRPYTVPVSQRELFRRELQRLVDIGVLEKCGRADWVAGTFCIPKKDGRI